ncbi:hypothetical protein [Streptomyces sp. NPDC059063]
MAQIRAVRSRRLRRPDARLRSRSPLPRAHVGSAPPTTSQVLIVYAPDLP